MRKKKLTDTAVQAIKPTGEPLLVYDTQVPGMGLRTMPSGHQSFVFVGRFPPSRNATRRSLGAYRAGIPAEELPEEELLALNVLSLAQARAKAKVWRRMIERGLDPEKEQQRRRAEREARERKLAADTFEAVARRFMVEHMASRRTARAVERLIEKKLIAAWGARPIAAITKRDVLDLIVNIRQTSGNEAARQTLAYTKLLFSWAMEMDLIEASPCTFNAKRSKLLAPKKARERVLTDDEIRLVWRATEGDALKTYPGAPLVRLLLILGCRRGELSRARWSEFDLRKPGGETWTLKGVRRKKENPRVLPLPALAVQMIKDLPRFAGGDFLFSASHGTRPFTAFSKMKTRLDGKIVKLNDGTELEERWCLHDLRRTMRTRLSALSIEPLVRKLMGGWKQQGIDAVYDLYAYQDEQRAGFEMWCARLRDIVEPPPENVVRPSFPRKVVAS
jgi:integrase